MEYCLLLNKGKQGTEYISIVCKDASLFTESVFIHDVWNWFAIRIVWHESQFSTFFKWQSSVRRLCLKHTRGNGGITLPIQPTTDQHLCSHLPVHVTHCGKTGGDRILPGGFHLQGRSTPFLPPSHVYFYARGDVTDYYSGSPPLFEGKSATQLSASPLRAPFKEGTVCWQVKVRWVRDP